MVRRDETVRRPERILFLGFSRSTLREDPTLSAPGLFARRFERIRRRPLPNFRFKRTFRRCKKSSWKPRYRPQAAAGADGEGARRGPSGGERPASRRASAETERPRHVGRVRQTSTRGPVGRLRVFGPARLLGAEAFAPYRRVFVLAEEDGEAGARGAGVAGRGVQRARALSATAARRRVVKTTRRAREAPPRDARGRVPVPDAPGAPREPAGGPAQQRPRVGRARLGAPLPEGGGVPVS